MFVSRTCFFYFLVFILGGGAAPPTQKDLIVYVLPGEDERLAKEAKKRKEKEEKAAKDQEEFHNFVWTSVEGMLKEFEMEVDEKNRKRTREEANEPVEEQGMLTPKELAMAVLHESKYYQDEDMGIVIPALHPYYNLPFKLQMLILDLPAEKLDECLDYIFKHAPDYDLYQSNM